MNDKMIRYILGWILTVEAGLLLLSCLVAVIYRERAGFSLLGTALLCAVIGGCLTIKKPEDNGIYSKEGFVIVALSWIVMSCLGAIPFVLGGAIPSYVDALFETVSGFSTTGASILSDVESLPKSLLFWRSFTHWIGGMGVLVFVMAVIPLSGGTSIFLMRAESPGPSVEKLVPGAKKTAFILYAMYIAITLVEMVVLLIGRMPVFDSIVLTLGTAGTGGFGIRNDSLGSYTDFQQIVVTVFMILFGVNFNAYYLLYRRKWKEALRSVEVRTYFLIILTAVILIAVNARGFFDSAFEAVKHSAFQVASVITTTGYSTVDFDLWPAFSKTILVVLMFVGACAGSTGGGMKVSRFILLFKSMGKELDYVIHPRNIRKVAMDGKSVEHAVMRSVNVYLVAYGLVFVVSLLLISLENLDMTTNFTAVSATLNNIGPGLSLVGPTGNFAMFSPFSKLVLIFDMLAGRLELFPMLILLSRNTWRRR
ncbi:MAG: TrkH family potassium uptake protein [Lachnospiraceae bacterium]|nr:TrkH family potassium uptake protein [Lachnospiraceae bacterium]